jgi:ammonia channel protein AmtB
MRRGPPVEITAQHVWLLIAAAMVLLMTPGLGLFYGGMTRAKAALNMIMMSFISAGIVGVVWVLWGYSMTTGATSTRWATASAYLSPPMQVPLEPLIPLRKTPSPSSK